MVLDLNLVVLDPGQDLNHLVLDLCQVVLDLVQVGRVQDGFLVERKEKEVEHWSEGREGEQ